MSEKDFRTLLASIAKAMQDHARLELVKMTEQMLRAARKAGV